MGNVITEGLKNLGKKAAKEEAKEAVKASIKTGTEDAARQAAKEAAKEIGEVATKEAVIGSKALPQWVTQCGNGVYNVGAGLLKAGYTPIKDGKVLALMGTGITGYGYFSDDGIVGTWQKALLKQDNPGDGILKGVGGLAFGKDRVEEHGLGGAATDALFGDGTTDQIAAAFDKTKEGIKHGYQATKDEIAGLKDQIAAKFDKKEGDAGSGSGNAQDQLQQYFQAGLTEDNVQLLQLLQANGMLTAPGGSKGNGGWGGNGGGGGIIDGIKDFIGNLFSNKDSALGALGLIGSLWGMFGRFSLLTKGAAAIAGYWSLGKLTDGLGEIKAARQQSQQRQVPQLEFKPITASQNYERLAVEDQDRQKITNRSL